MDLVDLWDARDFPLTWRPVRMIRIMLVLKVAHTAAHSEVPVQPGRVIAADDATGGHDARLLDIAVRLVVDALHDQGPLWQAFANFAGPDALDLRQVRLLLVGGGDNKTPGVAGVHDLHRVRAVLLFNDGRAHHRSASGLRQATLLRIPGVGVHQVLGVNIYKGLTDQLVIRQASRRRLTEQLPVHIRQLWRAEDGRRVATMPVQNPEGAEVLLHDHLVRVLVIISPALHVSNGTAET
mmetsp:Transcript_56879/g.165175  ORF Transcript_56879/g.165175 Transcript_56879/m.165175 type:complete len:238 (+) Transcript_56879:760-1473(+)